VNAYAAAMREIIQQVPNLSFLLTPHDIRGRVSDVMLAEAIYAAVDDSLQNHCLIIPTPCKPAEIKAMVAGLDFVLSGKMHLAIACLGQGVPVVCVAYQDKFEGLFQHFELDGLTIQPQDVVMPGKLSEFFIYHYQQREQIAVRVQQKLPAVRELAGMSLE
jgi:polysaccharide pyruvyl transferase WcaK-like protein